MQIKQFILGDVFTRCYVISENNKALVIDPGADAEKIYEYLEKNNLELKLIINTHGHFDHIGANKFLKEKSGAEILIHAKAADKLISAEKNLSLKFLRKEITSPTADKILEDGDLIDFESMTLKVLYTPGHSLGGISIYIDSEKALFSGDAIFSNGIGRTDLQDSNIDQLQNSIEKKLLPLDENVKVFPGHGPSFYLKDFKEKVFPKFF